MTVLELKTKKAAILQRKTSINEAIASIKTKCVTTLNRTVYADLETKRRQLVRELQKIDGELSQLNALIHEAAQQETLPKQAEPSTLIQQIIAIRDEYQIFAADSTRSPTMRRMASEFVVKLTPIIRKSLARPTRDL